MGAGASFLYCHCPLYAGNPLINEHEPCRLLHVDEWSTRKIGSPRGSAGDDIDGIELLRFPGLCP